MPEPSDKQEAQSRSRRRRARSAPDFEELFHLLIENVKDYALFILDRDGHTLTWNAGVKRLLGYEEEEFIGLPFEQFFRPEEQGAAEIEMSKAAKDGRSDDERWHVRKDGTEFWVTGVLTALRDPAGNLRGYAKIMRDTTAQRNASLERDDLLHRELTSREEAERANRMKDEFLAVVSHELRTPLNAIFGWAHLLATDHLDEAQAKRAIETINRNAKAQAQLVADLLDVSRIVTGKLTLNIRPIPVDQLVQGAIESVHHSTVAKKLRIALNVTGEPPPVQGDAHRLHQVVLNLLSNAIKFTPSGGTIDVNVEARTDDVAIIVRDTGDGIAPEQLPHVFDRFRQGASGRRPGGGLGLGLTIARHIVEAHRGSIEAQSEGEGKGARFIVRLPQSGDTVIDAASASSPAVDHTIERPPELVGRCALIVEDQPDSQELAAFILSHCEMRVLTAASVIEALQVLNAQPVDVIVSDIALNGNADGIDLIRLIRERPEPVGAVRAIAVSAHANSDDKTRALAAGYEMHLAKPIVPTELVGAVAALLRSRTPGEGPS